MNEYWAGKSKVSWIDISQDRILNIPHKKIIPSLVVIWRPESWSDSTLEMVNNLFDNNRTKAPA